MTLETEGQQIWNPQKDDSVKCQLVNWKKHNTEKEKKYSKMSHIEWQKAKGIWDNPKEDQHRHACYSRYLELL